ncbi:hypothetical protein E2K98_01805 [Bacillus salipaludis]|uniref:Uncharacterized protein n=1 Tax=Bacillus salipaludis TaxID=2547811 RepID=A0A4R5VZE9_9BACI|nr:hypothetical protein [Bacillus salipaludis]TDK65006.1 hypothetical protein E2K98_01805 [Bacillus salipaludis]
MTFIFKAVLKYNVLTMLIGAEDTKTPVGVRGRGETAQEHKRRGGSPDRPRTACAWSGNQLTSLTQPF